MNRVGSIQRLCRFLVKPDSCEGSMPYEASGSGHVELFDSIIYLKHVVVTPCKCDFGCQYFVWECSVDGIFDKEFPCEA